MAEDERKPSGCGLMGLYNGIFRRRTTTATVCSPRRSSSAGSLPGTPTGSSNSKRRRAGSSDDAAMVVAEPPHPKQLPVVPATTRAANPRATQVASYQQHRPGGGGNYRKAAEPVRVLSITRGISGELDSVIYDHQRAKGSSTLVRASSSNVMLFSDLGNIRGGANGAAAPNRNVLDHLPKTAKEIDNGKQRNTRGNGNANSRDPSRHSPPVASLCRALSRRLDPEELKEMGNEEYKKGNFAEAVAFYDRAIVIDPGKAAYRSNRAAALIGLGRLLEAAAECREAVRIDPCYRRAHHRLATLYLRLGEAEKASHHYKQSGNEATSRDTTQTQNLQNHLNKCNEARMLKDWQTVLKEAEAAISSGADSAPQVFAAQAEALLKLQRHQEADEVLIDAPTFDVDESTMFFGVSTNAYILAVRAHIDMAAGRFDDAVSLAQKATRIDPSSKDAAAMARRTRAVAAARSKGNDLFKADRFAEACTAYGEGLDHDSRNSVLLCNRAACRIKLGQWERAIEDCSMALNVRPSYSKARLRRADCNIKLEKWKEALQDYEVLIQDMPDDKEVLKALALVRSQLAKKPDEGIKETKLEPDVVDITTNDQFMRIVGSCRGASVVLFCDESSESKQMMPLMGQLCRQYPSLNFLKVDNEELTKSEEVNSLPTFRLYENSSRVKDIDGSDWGLLESSIKNLITEGI